MGIREDLVEQFGDEELLFADGYDKAIVGVDRNHRVVYDTNKMLEVLFHDAGMPYDEAQEWLEFNVFGAYVGDRTPVYIEMV